MSRRRVFETLPDVPPCPEGWRTGAPDFVIFGAQKSGTTWWFRLIEQHPDVVQPPKQRPELHFFDRLWGDVAGRGPHRLATTATSRAPRAASSERRRPSTSRARGPPPMVALAAPEARAIVLLRDPVERYVSGLSHQDRGGLIDEVEELVSAASSGTGCASSRTRSRGASTRPRSSGSPQAYPPERLLVLQYERCAADADAQLSRTYEYLGLAPHRLAPEELARPRNMAKLEKLEVPPQHLELLRRYYRPEVERLRGRMPDLDLSLWPNFADLA